jgi:hypothetical protein
MSGERLDDAIEKYYLRNGECQQQEPKTTIRKLSRVVFGRGNAVQRDGYLL